MSEINREFQAKPNNKDARRGRQSKLLSSRREDRETALQDKRKQILNTKHSSNNDDEINKFESTLNDIISDAKCCNDLGAILQHIELDKIKEFLQQQIKEANPIDLYFKSISIIDICGADVIRQCLSYLSIKELYRYQKICKTFKKLIKAITSSPALGQNYAKYNQRMIRFKNWMTQKRDKTTDRNLALFQLVESYGKKRKHALELSDLKGADQLMIKALNVMGLKVDDDSLTMAAIVRDCYELHDDEYDIWDEYPRPILTNVYNGYRLRLDRYFDYDYVHDYAELRIGYESWMNCGYKAGQMLLEVLVERPDAGPGGISRYNVWNVILIDVTKTIDTETENKGKLKEEHESSSDSDSSDGSSGSESSSD